MTRAKLLIVSTCGTSSLSNNASREVFASLRAYANSPNDATLLSAERAVLDHIAQRREQFLLVGVQQAKEMSAELNGALSYLEGLSPAPQHVEHLLLASDTYLGMQTASMVEGWLKAHGHAAHHFSFPGLRTDALDAFRDAVSELIAWAASPALQGYRQQGYHVVFNLTGGFKSVNGFMQSLGSVLADEIIYMFEGGSLLSIPRLPISLDLEGVVDAHQLLFRQLGGLEQPLPLSRCTSIPETLLLIDEQQCLLSQPWGELAWEGWRAKHYSSRLLESPSALIRFSDRFIADAQAQTNRYEVINTRIDDLARYLIARSLGKDPRHQLSRLDFKKLKGKPKLPSTHECDVWAEHGGKRIFCHFDEDDVLILDSLDDGLH